METAIRWSPHSTAHRPYFVILDVVKSQLDLCEATFRKPSTPRGSPVVEWKVLRHREKLPSYTAFDFSKNDPFIVGLGGDSGEASIASLNPEISRDVEHIHTYTVKNQRKCNSIAFSLNNYIATGLERMSRDHGLYVFDLTAPSTPSSTRPFRTLGNSEGITSIKFFNRDPNLLLAGVQRQCIRLYDLRDSSATSTPQFPTRLVHNLAIDPLDENYFISAAPDKEPIVGVWDIRMLRSSTTPSESGPPGSIMEIRSAIDSNHNSSVFSLRFSGLRRGCFGVLSSAGEVRIYELAQHHGDYGKGTMPDNPNGGTPWLSKTYTKRTHTLAYPPWHPNAVKDDKNRVAACDFIAAPGLTQNMAMLALQRDRKIKLLEVHTVPRIVNITALDEVSFWRNRQKVYKPHADFDTSAEELEALQRKADIHGHRRISEQSMQNSSVLANLSLDGIGGKTSTSYDMPLATSSGDQHEELLMLNFPKHVPDISDALKLLTIHRRRCEEGYSLDAQKNMKLVGHDHWLFDMWETIQRFDDMTLKDGMYFGGLDLSFLGVYAVWTSDFGTRNRFHNREDFGGHEFDDTIESIVHRKRYPPFKGHETKRAAARQLCLAICGWTFSKDVLRGGCNKLMDQGQYYRAIVIAVMRGFKDLAQLILKESIQKKAISNIGLGAVIACEVVSAEQREMCSWMAEETDDPYLKALLAYFVHGDWKVVCDMPIIPLSDRLGCAIKYLDDSRLDEFIKLQTSYSCISGNIEGLVLTGLTDRAVDLFARYISRHNDLQTAVLALSFSCPVFVADARFDAWRDTYLLQMQAWRAFHPRALYVASHTRRSAARAPPGDRFGDTPSRPVTLRCSHCLSVLAPHTLKKGHNSAQLLSPGGIVPNSAAQLIDASAKLPGELDHRASTRSGLTCPRCARAMPHCGICGLLLGMADPASVRAVSIKSHLHSPNTHATNNGTGGGTTGSMMTNLMNDHVDPIAAQALYCMQCLHVFHGHHAREWFARQRVCPVPECECMCGVLH